jgi:hypothetical protein
VPILERLKTELLSDSGMKKWSGPFICSGQSGDGWFFILRMKASQFVIFQENKEWMEALRSYKIMSLDFQGLTALLVSFKLYQRYRPTD